MTLFFQRALSLKLQRIITRNSAPESLTLNVRARGLRALSAAILATDITETEYLKI